MTKRKTQYIPVWKKTYIILKKLVKDNDEKGTRLVHEAIEDLAKKRG